MIFEPDYCEERNYQCGCFITDEETCYCTKYHKYVSGTCGMYQSIDDSKIDEVIEKIKQAQCLIEMKNCENDFTYSTKELDSLIDVLGNCNYAIRDLQGERNEQCKYKEKN